MDESSTSNALRDFVRQSGANAEPRDERSETRNAVISDRGNDSF